MANVIATAGLDRLMLIDAHTSAIEGFFDIPLEHLTAVPLLARAAAPSIREHSVVVAPDLGAVKRAREYARLLQVPMAFVHKTRLSGEDVEAHGIIGDVRNRAPAHHRRHAEHGRNHRGCRCGASMLPAPSNQSPSR